MVGDKDYDLTFLLVLSKRADLIFIPRRSETQRNAIRERSRPDFGDDFGFPAESRGFLRTDDGSREKRKH